MIFLLQKWNHLLLNLLQQINGHHFSIVWLCIALEILLIIHLFLFSQQCNQRNLFLQSDLYYCVLYFAYLISRNSVVYDLYGFIVKDDYVCVLSMNEKWYSFCDECVYEISESSIPKYQA